MMIEDSLGDNFISFRGLVQFQVNGRLRKFWHIADRAAMPFSRSSGNFEAMGVKSITKLPKGTGTRPEFDEDVRFDAVQIMMRNGSSYLRGRVSSKGRVSSISDKENKGSGGIKGGGMRRWKTIPHNPSTMSNDPRYTVEQLAECENYVKATNGWVRGISGHPGAPPPGYIESYRVRYPMAPMPSDFPEVEAAWYRRHETGECWSCSASMHDSDECDEARDREAAVAKVAAETMAKTVADMLTAALGRVHGKAVNTRPRRMPRYGISAGTRTMMGKPENKGRVGGGLDHKSWKRGRGGAKGAFGKSGRGGKKHGGRKTIPAGIKVAAVSVEGVEAVADVEPKLEPEDTLLNVEEDIHMDDFSGYRTDDEDDSAAGGVLGWNGEEAISV
ncbi:hypothetical protein C8R43DRAFT_975957, partial [Mycena crocata]